MKKFNMLASVFVIGVMILSACGAQVTPTAEATEPPAPATQPPIATEPPTATEAPVQPTETPTLAPVPVDLSGPPMEIGSKFTYVDGSVLVAVPGGKFIMGHGGPDNPEHEVNVSDFWLYRAKVTNSQYAFCVAQGKCTPPNLDKNKGYGDPLKANHPVTGVNYQQGVDYCSFVHGRLPTEAEWEKAARGPEGNIHPWGNAAPQCDLANYGTCKYETTSVVDHPAGQSFYEALDMAGNVYEWVADWYLRNYYLSSPLDDPLGPDLGNKRSVRSSGFDSPAYETESARRSALNPIFQMEDLGFRCVVEDPTYFAPSCTAVMIYGQDAAGGAPGGGGSSETCPNVGINVVPYCNGTIGAANVNFSGPPGATIDPGGCGPTGNPDQYACLSPTTVSIQADCQQNVSGSPTCPPGYQQQGNQCVSQGGPGECLPGFNYDPALQCCSAQPGTDNSFPLPQCPVGTYYVAAKNACVPYPAKGLVSVVKTVGIPDCTKPDRQGGGGGNSCPAQSCTFGSWDSTLCCCYSAAKGGCT